MKLEHLLAPANVSTPGDGSLRPSMVVRPTVSRRPSVLLTAGELDYPTEHLAAATFTDTFALGDKTNINLRSDGLGSFKNGLSVTGGSTDDIKSGLIASSNSLVLTARSTQVFRITDGLNNSITNQPDVQLSTTNTSIDTVSIFTCEYHGENHIAGQTLTGYKNKWMEDVGGVDFLNGFLSTTDVSQSTTGVVTGFNSGIASSDAPNGSAYNFYAAGSAPSYFKGVTEHEGGVKVTGGNAAEIPVGLYGTNVNLSVKAQEILNFVNKDGVQLRVDDKGRAVSLLHNKKAFSSNIVDGFTDIVQAYQFTGGFSDTGSVPAKTVGVGYFSGVNSTVNMGGAYSYVALLNDGGGTVDTGVGYYSQISDSPSGYTKAYAMYHAGGAPSYFKGDITCDGLINGAFSLRMDTDDPTAFQTTYSTDDEGNQVESQEYIGTTEDLLSIIKDLRARVAALEAAQP